MLASNKWLPILLLLNVSPAFGGSDISGSPYTYDFQDFFEFSREWQTETSFDRWDFDSNQFIDARDLLVMLGGKRLAVPPTPIVMVDVPAGSFMMGLQDDGGGGGGADELPAHSVTLSAYSIGKFEITNAQYVQWLNWAHLEGILQNNTGAPITESSGAVYAYGQRLFQLSRRVIYENGRFSLVELDGYRSLSEHPVLRVSWYGAVLFCNWLSMSEGLNPCYDVGTWTLVDRFGGGYRLPTEAEWERAAAWDGEKHWTYAFQADELSGKQRANYYDNDPTWANPWGLQEEMTCPVGWFNGRNVSPNGIVQTIDSPSPVGCYDMTGGSAEWCEDWYQADFYASEEATQNDPLCLNPASGRKVIRGGSWTEGPIRCRTTFRPRVPPGTTIERYGFRVARTIPEEPESMTLEIPDLPDLPEGARKMKLVRIGAGTFQMGSPHAEVSRYPAFESPLHPVTISGDFYIGETEVTQAQWQAVMGINPATGYGVGLDYPVYYVSRDDIAGANGFLSRLSSMTGLEGFRLPTEAEWEFACRAGTVTRFSFGDSLACDDENQDCPAGASPGNRSDYYYSAKPRG